MRYLNTSIKGYNDLGGNIPNYVPWHVVPLYIKLPGLNPSFLFLSLYLPTVNLLYNQNKKLINLKLNTIIRVTILL